MAKAKRSKAKSRDKAGAFHRHGVAWVKTAGRFCFGFILLVHVYGAALRIAPVPGTLTMVTRWSNGSELRYRWVPLAEVSPHLVRAVIAAEDARFCYHEGIDVDAVRTAIGEWRNGEGLRGGSTISQQTAKNIFLWNGGGLARKMPEAWLALFSDHIWGKRRTMEHYLNIAEWGDGLFGVDAAAQARFAKSARDLTAQEAALLAAVLPSPNKWRLDPPGPYVRQRATTLRARMRTVASEQLAGCVLDPATFYNRL